jgi:hypothetical protein
MLPGRGPRNDALIVTIYVVIDETMKSLGHQSHSLAALSDAEVLTLGQSQDYTALAVVERVPAAKISSSRVAGQEDHYHLRHLERPPPVGADGWHGAMPD